MKWNFVTLSYFYYLCSKKAGRHTGRARQLLSALMPKH